MLLYRLAPQVEIDRTRLEFRFEASGTTVLSAHAPDELVADDLQQLTQGIAVERLRSAGSPASVAVFFYVVERLSRSGLIEHVWSLDEKDSMVLRPLDKRFVVRETKPPDDAQLCRDIYLRPDAGGWVLRRAGSANEALLVEDSVLSWIDDLRRDAVTSKPVRELKELLWRYGFLEAPSPEGLSTACWEFHDLLFHHATREIGYGQKFGGTLRFKDRFPPPPAEKPPMSNNFTALPVTGFTAREDLTLTEAMHKRHSCRRHDDANPIRLDQLASFLYQCAHSEKLSREAGEQELLKRPIPAGGAIHELEFYPCVRLCEGLDPGLYHYHGTEHRLYLVASLDEAMPFIERAAVSWGNPGELPQLLVIGASRLPRLAWKYEKIAYRLSLLNAGVALQAMYLVATNLGLGGAALGAGDSSRFAQVTGLDPNEETSVVEFALGSPAG